MEPHCMVPSVWWEMGPLYGSPLYGVLYTAGVPVWSPTVWCNHDMEGGPYMAPHCMMPSVWRG